MGIRILSARVCREVQVYERKGRLHELRLLAIFEVLSNCKRTLTVETSLPVSEQEANDRDSFA
jgi:hypothetical protein